MNKNDSISVLQPSRLYPNGKNDETARKCNLFSKAKPKDQKQKEIERKEKMKSMEFKFVPVKGQRFDIGRIINIGKCDCKKCDFMNCPKNNYALKMKRKRYTVDEFIEFYSEDLKERGFLTEELLTEFMDLFSFPKGTYWNTNYDRTAVQLVSFNRKQDEVCKGTVNTRTGEIWEYDFSESQYKLACRISKGIEKVFAFIKSEWQKGKIK